MRTTSDCTMWRKSLVLVGVAALVAGTLACGGDEATDTTAAGTPYDVSVTEVAAPTERMGDVTLYAPERDGSWPVTVLFPGWDSARSTLDQLARALAAEGVVVATAESGSGDEVLAGEYECSQRLAVLSAWQHGGDPEAPVAVGGHSMGAALALMASVFDPFYSLTTGELLDCGLEGEDDLLRLVVGHDDFELQLGKEVHDVFRTTIELGVALLASESLDLADGQTLNSGLREPFLGLV